MKLLLVAVAICGWPAAVRCAEVDSKALYAATLIDLTGQPAPLARFRGRPMLVNFWARWCEPCRLEMPELQRAQRAHPEISVVGIALEDQAAAVAEFARAYELDYPILLAGEQGLKLLAALGDDDAVLPYTVLIDAAGRVWQRKRGGFKPQELDDALRALPRALALPQQARATAAGGCAVRGCHRCVCLHATRSRDRPAGTAGAPDGN